MVTINVNQARCVHLVVSVFLIPNVHFMVDLVNPVNVLVVVVVDIVTRDCFQALIAAFIMPLLMKIALVGYLARVLLNVEMENVPFKSRARVIMTKTAVLMELAVNMFLSILV
jgi:hypothetical protein